MKPVRPYAKVYVQGSREKICRFHRIFSGDRDPKKIKNFCLTGECIFSILSQLSAL